MFKKLFGDDFSLKKSNNYLHSRHNMPSTGILPGILLILYGFGFICYLLYILISNI